MSLVPIPDQTTTQFFEPFNFKGFTTYLWLKK
jgi:hypothetical protein